MMAVLLLMVLLSIDIPVKSLPSSKSAMVKFSQEPSIPVMVKLRLPGTESSNTICPLSLSLVLKARADMTVALLSPPSVVVGLFVLA